MLRAVFSLAALTCWLLGLALLASWPWVAGCLLVGGAALAGKAALRKDDLAALVGVAMACAMVYAVVQWGQFAWQALT